MKLSAVAVSTAQGDVTVADVRVALEALASKGFVNSPLERDGALVCRIHTTDFRSVAPRCFWRGGKGNVATTPIWFEVSGIDIRFRFLCNIADSVRDRVHVCFPSDDGRGEEHMTCTHKRWAQGSLYHGQAMSTRERVDFAALLFQMREVKDKRREVSWRRLGTWRLAIGTMEALSAYPGRGSAVGGIARPVHDA
jgi:hypothetical protein